jgi:hypothetical protein
MVNSLNAGVWRPIAADNSAETAGGGAEDGIFGDMFGQSHQFYE